MQNDDACRRPDNAKQFKGMKVGDSLYAGDLENGFVRYWIRSIDDHGYVKCVEAAHSHIGLPSQWACDWMFSSKEEAFADAVRYDLDYYPPRLAYAKRAEEALRNGLDISEFLDGHCFEQKGGNGE